MADRTADNSWSPEALASLALASGVGQLAAAYAVSRWLTRPTPSVPSPTPADFGLAFQPLECRTRDGFRLAGWVACPPSPRATVALFHGVRRNRAQMLERIVFLTAAGYRCIAFDHRAHGESSGQRTSFGFHERNDAIAVIGLVRRLWPKQPCAALGIAMGGAALCYAAAELRGLAAIVLESVYYDIAAALSSRVGRVFPDLEQLSRTVIWVTERRLGLKVTQLCPGQYVSALAPTPLLLITGTNDRHATPQDTEQFLAAQYPGSAEIWFAPGAGHREAPVTDGKAYQQRVLVFLQNCVDRDDAVACGWAGHAKPQANC